MYCIECGAPAYKQIPLGDSRMRIVCSQCAHIHYQNPHMICGALVVADDKILLCRRAIEPQYGFWTLPAGYMEIGETMLEGALRETYEEAQASGKNARLYCLFDIPTIGQIHALYLARLDGQIGCGAESLECALINPADIDPQTLAFSSIKEAIACYIDDFARFGDNWDNYPIHQKTLIRDF